MDQPKPIVIIMSVVALVFIAAGFFVGIAAENEAMDQQHADAAQHARAPAN